jgi:hypothetical protein
MVHDSSLYALHHEHASAIPFCLDLRCRENLQHIPCRQTEKQDQQYHPRQYHRQRPMFLKDQKILQGNREYHFHFYQEDRNFHMRQLRQET